MTKNLNRLGEWAVIEELVTAVFQETALMPPGEPVRDLVREAALSLSPTFTLTVAHAKLATLGYLFGAANAEGLVPAEVVDRMLVRILESARALKRLEALPTQTIDATLYDDDSTQTSASASST